MRFEVLMMVKMLILVFWVVMPHSLVSGYHCFGATYHLCLQCRSILKMGAVLSSETLVTTNKTDVNSEDSNQLVKATSLPSHHNSSHYCYIIA
jgi:hypothetical protein